MRKKKLSPISDVLSPPAAEEIPAPAQTPVKKSPDLNIFARRNRGLLFDIVNFLVNLFLFRLLVRLSLDIFDRAAEGEIFARAVLVMIYAGMLILPGAGAVLKRWHFHQRLKREGAPEREFFPLGCLAVPYLIVNMCISLAVSLSFMDVSESIGSESLRDFSGVLLLIGLIFNIVQMVLVFRYFLPPKRDPKSAFMRNPRSEILGDMCLFLNVILYQVVWSRLLSLSIFYEDGRLNSLLIFTIIGGLLYIAARIFFLAEDIRRPRTWLTMLAANLPLLITIIFFPPAAVKPVKTSDLPPTQTIAGKRSFVISAEDFYKEYKLSSQAGAKKYEGKYVTVTGRVKAVDMADDKSLGLAVRLDGGSLVRWVRCGFDDDQKETLKTLKENQLITVQGTGDKYWLGGPSLSRCVLISAE